MPLLSLVAGHGLGPAAVLAEADVRLKLFAGTENRIPIVKLGRLFEIWGKRTRCPHFGLLVGARVQPEALGALYSLMRTCITAAEALGRATLRAGANGYDAGNIGRDDANGVPMAGNVKRTTQDRGSFRRML
jgi:hypothetical protein